MSKKETGFCRLHKRDKAFCTISGFEVTPNLIHDRFSLNRCSYLFEQNSFVYFGYVFQYTYQSIIIFWIFAIIEIASFRNDGKSPYW